MSTEYTFEISGHTGRAHTRREERGQVYTFHRFNLLWSTIKIETYSL
jgi:hypothetical protein